MREIVKVLNPNRDNMQIWYFCKKCRKGFITWNHEHPQDLIAIPGNVKYINLHLSGNNLVIGREWIGWHEEIIKGLL